MDTPMHSIESENLIETEQNKQQEVNINQNFTDKNGQLSGETFVINFGNLPTILYLFLILLVFILLAIFGFNDLYSKLLSPLYGVIISLILMYKSVKKIVLVKDSFNKKVLIKLVNFLGLTQMKLNFDLENTHFYMYSEISVDDNDKPHTKYILFIINDHKNLEGINLNENNIKQKPVKCIYCFKEPILGKYNSKQFEKALNDFVGSSRDYKNPLLFDINTYLEDKKIKLYVPQINNKYVKFSEYFFTYYLKGYHNYFPKLSSIDITFTPIAILFNFVFTMAVCSTIYTFIEENTFIPLLITIIVCIIIDLIIYFLYKCLKLKNENIFKIDFIYSKDFDRVFIGVVKYNQAKYVNTFEYQKNNISKFVYEREGNTNSKNFNLKVELKNNEIQQLCTLKKQSQNELEGLICFLNREFIAYTNNLNSYQQI